MMDARFAMDAPDQPGRLIAHRGLSALAPENTLPAFELAGRAGCFWGIETDIHCAADGRFVCLHNEQIDEMTAGRGPVWAYTLDELRGFPIDAGSNIARYPGLTIPTLEEYLEVCRRYDLAAVIELKEDLPESQVARFYELLGREGMLDQCLCISFRYPLLQALRAITREIPVQYLVYRADRADVDAAAALGNSGIDFERADSVLLSYARRLGCTTNIWTVDDPGRQRFWRAAGIGFLTTNRAAQV